MGQISNGHLTIDMSTFLFNLLDPVFCLCHSLFNIMVTSGKNKKQVNLKEVLWGNQDYAKTSQFSDSSSIIIYFLH